eukprot:s5085_g3.t1
MVKAVKDMELLFCIVALLACDSGQGAVFLSVARGKVAEGIDFDRHYGRCVVLFGVPFQYTLSRELRARLEFLRQHYDIKESVFGLAIVVPIEDCSRVIRSKRDYGVMIFADQRIRHFLEPGHVFMATDLAVEAAGNFLLQMSQPYEAWLLQWFVGRLCTCADDRFWRAQMTRREEGDWSFCSDTGSTQGTSSRGFQRDCQRS